MYAFIIRRVLATIPVMGVVALFVFVLLHLGPGDPASVIAGDYATEADVAGIRARLGLDDPIHIQFLNWIWSLLRAGRGISIFSNLPVSTLIAQRVAPTLFLTLTTLGFAVIVAVPLGTVAAWKAGGWLDRGIMIFAVAGFSIPVFVLGYMMIYGFALGLGWLPVQGYRSPFEAFWPAVHHIILPSVTLSMIYIALIRSPVTARSPRCDGAPLPSISRTSRMIISACMPWSISGSPFLRRDEVWGIGRLSEIGFYERVGKTGLYGTH